MSIEDLADQQDEKWNEVLLSLDQMDYDQLRDVYAKLNEEERRVSYKRRILHGRIDIIKSEMMKKIKEDYQSSAVAPDKLAQILSEGGSDKRPSPDVTSEPMF